jgi:hypothetical protein
MPHDLTDFEEQLTSLLLQRFDSGTIGRGSAYYTAQKAHIEYMDEIDDQGAITVVGSSRGRGRNQYQLTVKIEFQDDYPRVKSTYCSCPMHTYCKHAVAILLCFRDAFITALDLTGRQTRDLSTVRHETLTWLELLEGACLSPPFSADEPGPERLIYILKKQNADLFSIQVCKTRRLKSGKWGKPAPFFVRQFDLARNQLAAGMQPADLLPLNLIAGLRSIAQLSYTGLHGNVIMYEDFELKGEIGGFILGKLLDTGRLFYGEEFSIPLKKTPSKPLGFEWRKSGREGAQALVLAHETREILIPVFPPMLLNPLENTLCLLESRLEPKAVALLFEAPNLTPDEALIVRSRLQMRQKDLPKAAIPLPVIDREEQTATPPKPWLYLTIGRFLHQSIYHKIEETYPIAECYFDYTDGVTLPASVTLEKFYFHTANGMYLRDTLAESKVLNRLEEGGLFPMNTILPYRSRQDSPVYCFLPSPPDSLGWLTFFEKMLPGLEAEGIAIKYAEDFPFEFAKPDDWFVDIDAQDGDFTSDWFNLDLGVMIEGERVSLVAPLIGLIKESPGLLAHLDSLNPDEKFAVRLDDRRILPIPVSRLRAWLRPLLEFLHEDRPRLSRYHATALAELEEEPSQWFGHSAQLRELGRRLKDFAGVAEALPAEGFQASLRGYQQQGLNWLQFLRSYGLCGILADDMGLGKTVQTLAHLHLEKKSGRADKPCLVVAPTSLLPNWASEAQQFTPELRVLTLHGADRSRHFENMGDADIILTTYPLLVRDQAILTEKEYHVLVLDEAQFIKNPKAQSHQVARQLKARHRLSLTGTPLENHLGELWAQFDFLMPGFLGAAKHFSKLFRTPIEKQGDADAHQRLSNRVAPFLLRRTKEEVLSELPPRTEIVRWIELSGAQRDLYESLRVAFDRKLRELLAVQGIGQSQIMILDALLKLRQVCCDPRLVKLESAQKLGGEGLKTSAKLDELMKLLEELLDEGRRILLFSQFTSMLGLIEAEFKKRKWDFAKLTGQTRDRETPVKRFQGGEVPIFMISLKAGGTGLNLTAADTVIHYDPWWNPAVEAQATARAHRIGQDKPVFVYKLLGRGTVEEKILSLQDRKRGLSDQLLSGQKDKNTHHLITAEDLDVLFKPLDQN